ncbi:hypothetical protein M405DRAFT_884181 [Rhizopogon salebrosus TDB-379]|nr:hypothetical protein M405DRAFT_884181 [Rhizopogon salebrosus TDB-379]
MNVGVQEVAIWTEAGEPGNVTELEDMKRAVWGIIGNWLDGHHWELARRASLGIGSTVCTVELVALALVRGIIGNWLDGLNGSTRRHAAECSCSREASQNARPGTKRMQFTFSIDTSLLTPGYVGFTTAATSLV